jgi:ATP-binding cassette, subfamily B (MDR/TAP), member 1
MKRPDRPILRNLSLTASCGQVLALCGESGGGKSSVMALVQNWYEPSSGDIYLDGIRTRCVYVLYKREIENTV